jgi:hypothetical protein
VGFTEGLTATPDSLNRPISGQDPRLTRLNDRDIMISYTSHRIRPVRIGLGLLRINDSNMLEIISTNGTIHPENGGRFDQKNWYASYTLNPVIDLII